MSKKQTIIAQLRVLRKQRGMTQRELAEKIGQTQQRIAEIESGEFSPSLDTLRPILKALGAELLLRDNNVNDKP
jgi:transcriptional regulator with XRE-family HTH domain